MRESKIAVAVAKAGIAGGLLLLPLANAYAVPSFARQTGQSCEACHTVFPQLTPFGRAFKLNGYTLTNNTKGQTPNNQIDQVPPLSAMLLLSSSTVSKKEPGSAATTNSFPEEFSLFYAGRISDSVGTFIQATYDGAEDHFGMDNADIRMVKRGGNGLVYGLTINNNPTVQDLWNSSPAWGYPYNGGQGLDYATQIEDGLGQQVAGVGGYAYFNNQLYAELTMYGRAPLGGSANADVNVSGTAPYWRLAWEHAINSTQNIEVGTYGMQVKEFLSGVSGPTNKFTDTAVDAQYQYLSNPTTLTVHASYINEKAEWDPAAGAANSSDNLHTFKVDGTYYRNRTFGGTISYFSTTGGSDAGIYATSTAKPNSDGMVYELDYLPWLNTKFTLQYTAYSKFDGASSNYDGSGRSASDNNTLYLSAWLMF